MALKMKDKSKVTRKYYRAVITGMPDIGKSTAFATIAKRALVLDLERRWPKDMVQQHDFPEFIENYAGIKELLNNVLAEPKLENDWLVLDSATAILKIIRQHSITVDFRGEAHNYADYSKGDKSFAPNYMQEILTLCDRIGDKHGINVGLVCHTYAKPQANPVGKDYQKQCLDLPDRVGAAVMQWSDIVGYAFNDVVVAQDGLKMKAKGQSRVITFNDSPAYEAKNGSPHALPAKIPFDKEGKWADLVFGKRPLVNEMEALIDQFPEEVQDKMRAEFEKAGFRAMPDEELKGLIAEGKKQLAKQGGK